MSDAPPFISCSMIILEEPLGRGIRLGDGRTFLRLNDGALRGSQFLLHLRQQPQKASAKTVSVKISMSASYLVRES